MAIPYLFAYSLAYIAGIVIAYVTNSAYVFAHRTTIAGAMLFPLIYVVQYVVGVLSMWLLIEQLGLSANVAILIVIGLSVPITFFLSRRLFLARSP